MRFFSVSKRRIIIANSFLLLVSVSILSCDQGKNAESSEKPEDNRFTRVVLAEGFDEPMAIFKNKDAAPNQLLIQVLEIDFQKK